jgi:hypothetical protein
VDHQGYAKLIGRYEAGGAELRAAVAGLTAGQLRAFPVPGTWSIHQIVVHMMDSDLIGSDRMKRIIAEDNPTLVGYDESRFADRLSYHEQPADEAVEIFDRNRRLFAVALRRLPAEAFDRTGHHTETGRIALGYMLGHYVEHLDHHLEFVRRKRAMLGA